MTGRALTIIFVFVSLHLAGSAWAQSGAPQVQIQVERNTVTVGELFWARITVTSESGGAMVSLPPNSPFELVARGGTSSSFQMQSSFSGGMQVTHQESMRWQLRASRTGRHTLGPMVVTIAGQQYRAGVATIEVIQGTGSPPANQQPNQQQGGSWLPPSNLGGFPTPMPTNPMPPQPQPPSDNGQRPSTPGGLPGQIDPSELDGANFDNELFIRTVIEPAEAYVGQQVVMSIYIYSTIQLSNVSVTREASTDGFWSEDLLGPTRRLRFEDQFIGQSHFRVALLRRVALFPLREGTLTIGAPQLEASTGFRSIFSRRGGTVARQGVPVQVQVRPLPTEGRPDGFETGNVGRYNVSARVDRQSTKVGEPVTLTLTVSGRGHLKNVKLPPLRELEGARVYEPRMSDAVLDQGGRIGGERRWEYLILPQKAGPLEIPEVTLDYFDPELERYMSKTSKALTVSVGEGNGGSSSTPSGAAEPSDSSAEESGAETELSTLRSIRRHSALSTQASPLYGRWWFFLVLFAVPLGFIAIVVVQKVRDHRLASRGIVKARKAAQVARKELSQVDGSDTDESLAKIAKAMNGFFVDRFGKSATGQTMDELRDFLEARDASKELSKRVVALLERCEMGRFAGGGATLDGAKLASEASDLLLELDELRAAPEEDEQ